ncbi:hypothetical protein P9112_006905 [Eukaryota sp. TZLM1-RC]
MPILELVHAASCSTSLTHLFLSDQSRTYKVGRLETSDLSVIDQHCQISRTHFLLFYRDSQWFLQDTSLNGTCVNGVIFRKQHEPIALNIGTTVSIICGTVSDSDNHPLFYLKDSPPTSPSLLSLPAPSLTTSLVATKRTSSTDSLPPIKSCPELPAHDDRAPIEENTTDNSSNCSICFEILVNAHVLPDCGHCFCFVCLVLLLKSNRVNKCPNCREVISKNPKKCFDLNNVIERFVVPNLNSQNKKTFEERYDQSQKFSQFQIFIKSKNDKNSCHKCSRKVAKYYVKNTNNKCFCLECLVQFS